MRCCNINLKGHNYEKRATFFFFFFAQSKQEKKIILYNHILTNSIHWCDTWLKKEINNACVCFKCVHTSYISAVNALNIISMSAIEAPLTSLSISGWVKVHKINYNVYPHQLISHLSVVAAIHPQLCHETRKKKGQGVAGEGEGWAQASSFRLPNTHESLDRKATDASSNYTVVYESIFCPSLNCKPPLPFFLRRHAHKQTHTPHTPLDINPCPPEHNAGHDWDTTPMLPHGESNKHWWCVKDGGCVQGGGLCV